MILGLIILWFIYFIVSHLFNSVNNAFNGANENEEEKEK